jgi:hypothetical protein
MIDTYEIGARIVLNDKINGQLANLDSQFGVVERSIERINSLLNTTTGLMSSLTGSARGMASAWNAAANAAERMSAAASRIGVPGGGGGFTGGLGGYLPFDDSGRPNFTMSGNDYDGVPRLTAPGMSIFGPGGPGGGGRGGNGSGGDGGQPGGFSPMNAMSSIFVARAGAGMVGETVGGFFDPSFSIQTLQQNIKNMTPQGTDPNSAVAQAMRAAIAIQQNPATPGVSIGQALAMIGNLYSVDRNMDAVSAMSQAYAMDGAVLSQAKGGADANDQLYSILRSSEDLGRFNLLKKDGTIDTSKATAFMDMYTKLIVNSNGNLSGQGAITLIGQAGPAATQLSDTALERAILLSQSLTPSQIGTGLNAMSQEFIGGKMSQATARSLHDAGVLPDYMFGPDDKILNQYKYGIGQVMLPPGVLKDEHLALTDPIEYASKYLFAKYLNADGSVRTGDQSNVDGLIASLNRDFSRIPGMRLAGEAIFTDVVRDRQIGNVGSILSVAQIAAANAGTGQQQAAGVGAAFNAFLNALGSPLLPGATKGLNMLTVSLNALSNTASAHPTGTGLADEFGLDAIGYGAMRLATILPARFGGAAAARVAGAAEGPVGWSIIGYQIAEATAKALANALVNAGLDGRDIAGGIGSAGSSAAKPLYVKQVGTTAPTTMPTGQTGSNPNKSLPPPGKPMTR